MELEGPPNWLDRSRPATSSQYRRSQRIEYLEVTEEGAAARESLERFIAARFAQAYDARIAHFCRHLVGMRDAAGAWRGAAGYTPARDGPLFLEHYLASPIESVLEQRCGAPVARDLVVEVGNLAATSVGTARQLIAAMGPYLLRREFAWVVFTATREIRNSFARLNRPLVCLGRADAERLPDRGGAWGRYYARDPHVVAGDLRAAIRRGAAQ